MLAEKQWTKTDPKYSKSLHYQLVCLSYIKQTSVLETVQEGGGNITQTRTTTKGRDPNKNYVEVLNNIGS